MGNLDAWRGRFDGASYPVLLANAYLARWYREPLEVMWFRSYSKGNDMPDYGVRPERHGKKCDEVKKGVEELVAYGLSEWLKEKGNHKRAAERILRHPAWLARVDLGLQKPLFGEFADWFARVTLEDEPQIEREMRPREGLPRIIAKLFNTGPQTWAETPPLGAYFRNGTPEQGRLLFAAVLRAIHMCCCTSRNPCGWDGTSISLNGQRVYSATAHARYSLRAGYVRQPSSAHGTMSCVRCTWMKSHRRGVGCWPRMLGLER